MLAGGLRLILFQPCEPRTEQDHVTFFDTFGKRIGFAEEVLCPCLRELQSLPGILLIGKCADLNDPSGPWFSVWLRCRHWRNLNGGCDLGRGRRRGWVRLSDRLFRGRR